MDTVFDPGTAADRPFAIDDKGIATGPGVTDMKSGLLAGLYAIAALRETVGLPLARIVFVANPDEEIGSPASTPHIRRVAADADACLVLECARMNGDIVELAEGERWHPGHRPRARLARRHRAREGPQLDPRGGPHGDRAPGAQRDAGRA